MDHGYGIMDGWHVEGKTYQYPRLSANKRIDRSFLQSPARESMESNRGGEGEDGEGRAKILLCLELWMAISLQRAKLSQTPDSRLQTAAQTRRFDDRHGTMVGQ